MNSFKMEMEAMENCVKYHRIMLKETLERLDVYRIKYEQIETINNALQERCNELEARNTELALRLKEKLKNERLEEDIQ